MRATLGVLPRVARIVYGEKFSNMLKPQAAMNENFSTSPQNQTSQNEVLIVGSVALDSVESSRPVVELDPGE